MINPQDLLNVAVGAAREAGALIEQMAANGVKSADKGFRDLVTEADLASQTLIVDYIRARFPKHGFIGEEDDDTLTDNAQTVWIIDPIDGTSNYSRQIPLYCVSIAAAVEGKVVAGAVYDPKRDEMFAAATGNGATVNGQPLAVSSVVELGEAAVAADFSRSAENRSEMVALLTDFIHQPRTVRYVGSAALVMCWVAAGRFDAYFNQHLGTWDWAAASLVLQEAGGTITNFGGDSLTISREKTPALASNRLLHAVILPYLT